MLMARFCDEKALEFGEVIPDACSALEEAKGRAGVEGGGDVVGESKEKELVGKVVGFGGDCCVPKKKEGKVDG